jgi:serine/threonine-protein kinase
LIDLTGRTLSRYKLLEEVGQGGMAVVWRGLDTTLNREVAVKVLHPHLAGQAESRARLEREAHAVAKLRHENILEIFDYSGPDSPDSYIVTEFIHGRTLKSFLAEHPLAFPEAAEMIASEVARALEHAHRFGVIHRDVKPENVMIRSDGLIKLTDFGIAQIVDKERMTITGQLLGSPAYMAPEHVEGRALDFRTDVFALGILTYQLATGQLPFRGKNPHEVLKRIAECKYTPPEAVNPLVGARLARAIARALEREPDRRFPDVSLLHKELVEDLADAGIDDARQELVRFFADPRGWQKGFGTRLVAALTARGRALATQGRTAAALELWSRALAHEPKSPELGALVDGVARRRRAGKLRRIAAVVLLVAAAAILPARALLHRHPAPPPAPAPAPVPAPAPARVNAAPPPPLHRAAPRPLSSPSRAVREPSAPRAPVTRRFELVPFPRSVKVTIDGQPRGEFGPQLSLVDLGPGPHRLYFESEFCYPKERLIAADEAAGKVPVRLAWKPATLRVRSEPPDADVLVDDPTKPGVYRAGQTIPVPIPERSPDGRRTIDIRVSARGHESRALTLELRAAEDKTQSVTLKPLGNE